MAKRKSVDGSMTEEAAVETTKTPKRRMKECCVCYGRGSFTFECFEKGCRYEVCVECSFKFAHFVNGCTFEKFRIKCMVCKHAVPSENIEDVVSRMLSRRKSFYAVLRDSVTDERVVIAKDDKDITIAKVTSYLNRFHMIVNLEPQVVEFVPPPPPPAYVTNDVYQLILNNMLASLTPAYQPNNQN
jgi:hypothetical protein